jgi:hypothetical protein
MAMFRINEEKLRAAFAATGDAQESAHYRWIEPFDPMSIDADDLHRIVDDCLERDIIERDDPRAMIAVYPQAISDPEPLLAVNPGSGPLLLGGLAIHHVAEGEASTPEGRSVIALLALVEDANAIYTEYEAAKMRSRDGDCGAGQSREPKEDSRCD